MKFNELWEDTYQRKVSDKHFDRNQLPQIRRNHIDDSPFKYKEGTISLDKIKPVQTQRVQGLSKKAQDVFKNKEDRPFIIDKNNYLINGHHRYDAAHMLGITNVKVLKIDADIEDVMKHFSHTASDTEVMKDSLKKSLAKKIKQRLDAEAGAGGGAGAGGSGAGASAGGDGGSTGSSGDGGSADSGDTGSSDSAPTSDAPVARGFVGIGTYMPGAKRKKKKKSFAYGKGIYETIEAMQDLNALLQGIDADLKQRKKDLKKLPKKSIYNEKYLGRNLNPDVADYVKGKKTKLIKVRVADLDDDAEDDRFGRVIDVDTDVGVDLDQPILIDKDGVTILDGFHRVYQAKRIGREFIPAEIIDENFAKPQFDVEWEEANRYPFLDKLGKDGWITLAQTGKVVNVNSNTVKKIGNTGADGSETFADLEPEKVARFKKAKKSGTIEMPIVMKMPNGKLELIAGNTRLIGLISSNGKAKVWYIDASKLDENFADGKKKGKSRPGRVKRSGASCKGSVTSLRKKAKDSSGEKSKMYHWCANMKSGRNK